jgi:hypothetical protein
VLLYLLLFLVILAIPFVWIARNAYYGVPERRQKWHQLSKESVKSSVGPEQVQPIRSSLLISNTTDSNQWDTVEISGKTLVIKNSSGELIKEIDLSTVYDITSSNPGVVTINLEKPKFLSTGSKQAIALDFRLSLTSWAAWNAGGLVQALPPKWIASSNSKLIQADRKALAFYSAAQKARQS